MSLQQTDQLANGFEARAQYQKNKATQHTSKARSLLIGEDATRPITPVQKGRKSVPHPGEHMNAPFATFNEASSQHNAARDEIQGGQMSKTYLAKTTKKEGADKPVHGGYDADVYRQQLMANAANMAAQKTRNWGSANLLGQTTPASHP